MSTPDGPTSGNKVHGRGRGFWSVWSNYVLFLFLKISGGAFSLRTQLLSICIDQEKKRRGFATHAHAHKYEHTETQQKSGGFSTLALNREKKRFVFCGPCRYPAFFFQPANVHGPLRCWQHQRFRSHPHGPGLDLPRRTRRGYFFFVVVVARGAGLLSNFSSEPAGRDAAWLKFMRGSQKVRNAASPRIALLWYTYMCCLKHCPQVRKDDR